jgi:flagellar motor switch protein FliN/FliY
MNSSSDSSASLNEKNSTLSADARSILEQLKPYRKVPINVSVELGKGKLRLRDLLELRYHSVFALDENAGSKLTVYVNGIPVGKGEPVILDDQVGIKIDEILDSQR